MPSLAFEILGLLLVFEHSYGSHTKKMTYAVCSVCIRVCVCVCVGRFRNTNIKMLDIEAGVVINICQERAGERRAKSVPSGSRLTILLTRRRRSTAVAAHAEGCRVFGRHC